MNSEEIAHQSARLYWSSRGIVPTWDQYLVIYHMVLARYLKEANQ